MTKSIMNVNNNNNLRGHYPVFLGEDLGFADTVNVTYPEIERMYLDQRAQYWVETEFSLDQDRKDLAVAPDSEKDVMILNLLAQHLLDSVASRGIIETFGPFITNTEVQNLLTWQSMMEGIHAISYSHIFRNCFTDGNQILERGKHNVMVQYRTGIIGEIFKTKPYGCVYLGVYSSRVEETTSEEYGRVIWFGSYLFYGFVCLHLCIGDRSLSRYWDSWGYPQSATCGGSFNLQCNASQRRLSGRDGSCGDADYLDCTGSQVGVHLQRSGVRAECNSVERICLLHCQTLLRLPWIGLGRQIIDLEQSYSLHGIHPSCSECCTRGVELSGWCCQLWFRNLF
ncbi:putative ribonucleoside reductase beta chain [Nitrincola phage 1M3-16]|uniref:ribonucleotide reductase class Ia beta subunit n=1 Tax=Nitrincola phage 1M3-16 TaxID=1472912 RepID=UPI000444D214|nr:ribonucleotide reductase class Ia beta subunit [Nitrincola phage 1M3-16]AHX01142.1 putative ribonucleoside reductase beta chain [Nitrincola phage 1M3-16]